MESSQERQLAPDAKLVYHDEERATERLRVSSNEDNCKSGYGRVLWRD